MIVIETKSKKIKNTNKKIKKQQLLHPTLGDTWWGFISSVTTVSENSNKHPKACWYNSTVHVSARIWCVTFSTTHSLTNRKKTSARRRKAASFAKQRWDQEVKTCKIQRSGREDFNSSFDYPRFFVCSFSETIYKIWSLQDSFQLCSVFYTCMNC